MIKRRIVLYMVPAFLLLARWWMLASVRIGADDGLE